MRRRWSRWLPRRPRRPGQSVEALARRHRARALTRLLLAAVAGYAALQAGGDAGLALFVAAALLALAGAHGWRLAGRWDVGAASERAVAGQLRRLERRGWLVWHDLDKPRGGNVDHLAVAPGGAAFAIETKTARYRRTHLAQARDGANWAARRLGCPSPRCCASRAATAGRASTAAWSSAAPGGSPACWSAKPGQRRPRDGPRGVCAAEPEDL